MPTCTCFALRKLSRTVSRFYDWHLGAAGLKTTQYSLLRSIAFEPLPVAALAARLSIERTTLTRNLKPLIDAGWVVLEPGNDARQKIVVITPAGRKAIDAATQAWQRAQSALDAALGRRAILDLHRMVAATLEKLTPLGR